MLQPGSKADARVLKAAQSKAKTLYRAATTATPQGVIVEGKPAPTEGIMAEGLNPSPRVPRPSRPAKAQPAAAATEQAEAPKTVTVNGITLPSFVGIEPISRPKEAVTAKADAISAKLKRDKGLDTDLDRARAAATAEQTPLKDDKDTVAFVTYLRNLSETAQASLRQVFTKADNPYANPNFDLAKTKAKLQRALKAAQEERRKSGVSDAAMVADKDYSQNNLTTAMELAIATNDVNSVLDQIIEETTDPVYKTIAAAMRRIGIGTNIRMARLEGYTSRTYQGLATLNTDGSTDITWLDDGGLTNEVILHELIHAFVQQRWGAFRYYTEKNRATLKDTKDRNDAVVAEYMQVWDDVSKLLMREREAGVLSKTDPWVISVIENPDELLTYGPTRFEARRFLSRYDVNGNRLPPQAPASTPNMWQRILRAIGGMIGLKKQEQTPKVLTMLDRVLMITRDVIEAGATVETGDFNVKLARALAGMPLQNAAMKDLTPKGMNANMTKLSGSADKVGSAAKRVVTNLQPGLRRRVLYFMSLGDIAARYGKMFVGQITKLVDSHRFRTASAQKMSQIALMPYEQYEALRRKDKQLADTIGWLMSMTQYRIDPRKSWDEHKHLQKDPKAAELRALVEEANQKFATIQKRKAASIYNNFAMVNEGQYYAQHTMSLWNQLRSNSAIRAAIPSMQTALDPMENFTRRSDLHGKPENFRNHWKREYDKLVGETMAFLKTQKAATVAGDADAKKLVADVASVRTLLRKIKANQAAMNEAPYFHLGRFGDYFVAFQLKPSDTGEISEDGKPIYETDTAAAEALNKALLDAGFDDPTIRVEGTDQRGAFIRLDTEDEYLRMAALMEKLRADGVIGDAPVVKGKRDQGAVERIQSMDQVVQNLLRNFASTPIAEDLADEERAAEIKYRQRVESDIRRFYIDQLPDIASAKIMQRRESVQGFSRDMIRAYAYRSQVGAHALANLSAMSKMTRAFADMREQLRATQKSSEPGAAKRAVMMREVLQELITRENERASHEGFTWVDRFKAYNHAYFLGMSPAYVMSQLTQPMTLLWPEIAKKQGFAKAAKTIAKVTPLAYKVVQAAISAGAKKGFRHVADSMVTEDALVAAGIAPKDVEFIMRVVNTGAIDIGSAAREHGRVVEGKTNDTEDLILRYAASMGFYSEVFTRTMAALAAREAADKTMSVTETDDYVTNVIDQSMLNYSQWYISRASGKGGMLGPLTPLAFSFLQYSFQVIEKLVREITTGFVSAAATPQEKKEARRFVGAHLAAITLLAGSLGLPAASVFARVIEVMADALGDDEEPYDAKAAWRNYLADVFGKDVGEVLARGLPRALNMDLSGRVGEADILPFTKLLTDKQTWTEAMKDWAFRSLGAPTTMVTNVLSGGQKFMQGDAIGGMREALPIALRGPLEAGRMLADGTYVDKFGNKMPMTPGASDILVQLIGITPSAKAEMNEAAQAQRVRQLLLRQNATSIRNKLAVALERGDMAEARQLMTKARKFDADNPAFAILPGFSEAFSRRQQRQVEAEVSNLPLGVDMGDIGAVRLTDYANY